MNEVYLHIAKEDAAEIARGNAFIHHEVHPGAFLQVGLELEEQQ